MGHKGSPPASSFLWSQALVVTPNTYLPPVHKENQLIGLRQAKHHTCKQVSPYDSRWVCSLAPATGLSTKDSGPSTEILPCVEVGSWSPESRLLGLVAF